MPRVVMLVLACSACWVEADPFNPTRYGSGRIVTASGDGKVTGVGFELAFASVGVKLPTSLVIGSTEVFEGPDCTLPSPLGTSVFPLQTTHGGTLGGVVLDEDKNFHVALATGPAVAKIEVRFEVPYRCGPANEMQITSGSSLFTIYPSGRIVRHDRVRAVEQTTEGAGCGGCGGSIGAGVAPEFQSFWRFDDKAFTGLDEGDNVIASDAERMVASSCALYGSNMVGLRWHDTGRASVEGGASQGLAFAFDLFQGSTATALVGGEFAVTSVLALATEPSTCASLLERTRLPELATFDGDVEPLLFDPATQLYSGTGDYSQFGFEIRTQDPTDGFTEGFAVELDLGDLRHVDLRRKSGEDLRVQIQPRDNLTVLWIEDGIPVGDAILVEAL